jgi:hypothetical protein
VRVLIVAASQWRWMVLALLVYTSGVCDGIL